MPQQKKTTYGLIGNPVVHSLSPVIHNIAFKELNVDAVYELFPLEEHELGDFFTRLKEKSSCIFGLNVTVPYKEKVIPFLDSLSPFAQKANAVNTIVITKKRQLKGFNTDGPGFLTHLVELGFDTKEKRVAILGAGGASRAIVAAFCVLPQKPNSIKIYDLYPVRTEKLIADLGQKLDASIVQSVSDINDLNIEISDLLINATPIGMKETDPCLIDGESLHAKLLVVDCIYKPLETKLLKLAKAQGARTANGLGMLFYQAVLAFQHWADIELADDIKDKMRRSLREAAGDDR
ncbi:MAG: shikimate dehydrogenase [Candidatus Omnitrophota bacterium]